ncbi:hypothetical protein Tco_0556365 [Tanacetum coccineum]
MHGDETPDAYLNRAQEYADALAAIGEPVKDKDLVMLVVSDTGANSHVTPDLEAMGQFRGIFGASIHVGKRLASAAICKNRGVTVEEEDRGWICFLGGNSSLGTKKYRGSNSSDGGNTGDGVKTTGGAIGSGDEIEFSEELKELLSDEVGK